jgi:hypothetical protein
MRMRMLVVGWGKVLSRTQTPNPNGFINQVMVGDFKKYRATKWGLEFLETFKRMRKFFAALEDMKE